MCFKNICFIMAKEQQIVCKVTDVASMWKPMSINWLIINDKFIVYTIFNNLFKAWEIIQLSNLLGPSIRQTCLIILLIVIYQCH